MRGAPRVVATALVATIGAGSATLPAFGDGHFFSEGGPAADAPASLSDLAKAEGDVQAIWAKLPFGTRHAMIVKEKAEGFGAYNKREDTIFVKGNKVVVYFEPVGYGYKDMGGDLFQFGITIDFEVTDGSGAVLGGQKALQKVDITSHARNREFYSNFTLDLTDIPAGDYGLGLIVHDDVTGKTTRVDQRFTVKAPG